MISVSDPYGMIASDIVLTLFWGRVVIIIIRKGLEFNTYQKQAKLQGWLSEGLVRG